MPRCRCRPACLTDVAATDRTLIGAGGPVLLEHAHRLPSDATPTQPAWPGPSPIGVRRGGLNFSMSGKGTV